MTDRDHFAAAALTGLLARPDVDADPLEHHFCCEDAYKWADAMLRERERTNHDAAPAARASLPTADHAVRRGREGGSGTGDTQEPVAWAVVSDSKQEIDCEFVYQDAATAGDVALDINGGVVPLYRKAPDIAPQPADIAPKAPDNVPQPTLTDAEREAVAWGVMRVGGSWVSILANEVQAETSRKSWDNRENWVHEVVPLYSSPTLTDDERAAIACAVDAYALNDADNDCRRIAATLRGLLERLK